MASVHEHHSSPYWQANFRAWDHRRGWIRKAASTQVPLTKPKERAQIVANQMEEAASLLGPDSAETLDESYFTRLVDELRIMSGAPTPKRLMTWQRWRAMWLAEQTVGESTLHSYGSGLELFEQFLSNPTITLRAITRQQLEAFHEHLVSEGMAKRTVEHRYHLLRRCLERAKVLGYLDVNPAAAAKLSKQQREDFNKQPFTLTEARSILKHAEGDWKTVCLFGYCYGMRIGDATHRKWSEIIDDEIRFEQQKKAGRGLRLPLTPRVKKHLESLERSSEWITPKLAVMQHSGQNRAFTRLMDKAGVKQTSKASQGSKSRGRRAKTFHSWRHTNKTLLIRAGVPQRVADLINDHESDDVSKRYTHTALDEMREALEKL